MKLIIDTDPGIDDAMAYYYAHAHPDIELLALTTIFGNVTIDNAVRNALWLTESSGAATQVYKGAAKPLSMAPNPPSDFVHGPRGFGEVKIPDPERQAEAGSAADYLVEMARAHPDDITVCAIGPLTNIALAIEKDPHFIANLKQLVIMGGVLRAKGNVSDVAEANFWNDPHAANIVLTAPNRGNVICVGLDITDKIAFTAVDFEDLAHQSPKAGGFLKAIGAFYLSFYESRSGRSECSLHDPSAVIACLHPEVFDIETHRVAVTTSGKAIGQMHILTSSAAPLSHICVGGDAAMIKDNFMSITGRNP
jgi:inosine-uridine nucleoside N-ribohydrolase